MGEEDRGRPPGAARRRGEWSIEDVNGGFIAKWRPVAPNGTYFWGVAMSVVLLPMTVMLPYAVWTLPGAGGWLIAIVLIWVAIAAECAAIILGMLKAATLRVTLDCRGDSVTVTEAWAARRTARVLSRSQLAAIHIDSEEFVTHPSGESALAVWRILGAKHGPFVLDRSLPTDRFGGNLPIEAARALGRVMGARLGVVFNDDSRLPPGDDAVPVESTGSTALETSREPGGLVIALPARTDKNPTAKMLGLIVFVAAIWAGLAIYYGDITAAGGHMTLYFVVVLGLGMLPLLMIPLWLLVWWWAGRDSLTVDRSGTLLDVRTIGGLVVRRLRFLASDITDLCASSEVPRQRWSATGSAHREGEGDTFVQFQHRGRLVYWEGAGRLTRGDALEVVRLLTERVPSLSARTAP